MRRNFGLVLFPFLLSFLPAQQTTGVKPSVLVFSHVTVVDVTGAPVQSDMTVVIAGNRITEIGPTQKIPAPKNAEVVDATGKFLIPGLWDMHVHTFFGKWVPGGREVTLPLFVANGITGVRDMGSDLEPILEARKETSQGTLLGPRMIVAGPMLDGPKTQFPASIAIATPEDGRRAVDMLKSRGVDFIKIQSYVPRDAYFAIAEECKNKTSRLSGTCQMLFAVPRHQTPARKVSSISSAFLREARPQKMN